MHDPMVRMAPKKKNLNLLVFLPAGRIISTGTYFDMYRRVPRAEERIRRYPVD